MASRGGSNRTPSEGMTCLASYLSIASAAASRMAGVLPNTGRSSSISQTVGASVSSRACDVVCARQHPIDVVGTADANPSTLRNNAGPVPGASTSCRERPVESRSSTRPSTASAPLSSSAAIAASTPRGSTSDPRCTTSTLAKPASWSIRRTGLVLPSGGRLTSKQPAIRSCLASTTKCRAALCKPSMTKTAAPSRTICSQAAMLRSSSSGS